MARSISLTPSDGICAGDQLTIKVSGLIYGGMSSEDYYYVEIYIDNDHYKEYYIPYGNSTYSKSYTIPNGATNEITVYLYSYISGVGNVYHSSVSIDVVEEEEEEDYNPPSGGSISFQDRDGNSINYLVQGITPVTCITSGWKPGSGSIYSYIFKSPDGNKSYSSSSTTYAFGAPASAGWLTYSVTAYNTYEISTSISEEIYCYPYSAPSISYFTAYRSDSFGNSDINGEYITCEFKATYSSVGGNNNITIKIYCDGKVVKEIQNTTGTTGKYTTSTTYDIDTQHDLYATIIDTYDKQTTSQTAIVYPSGKILNISADGDSIGIGGMAPSESGMLECYWNAQFSDNVKISKLNDVILPDMDFGVLKIRGATTITGVNFHKTLSGIPIIHMIADNHEISYKITQCSIRTFSVNIETTWTTTGDVKVYWIAMYLPD